MTAAAWGEDKPLIKETLCLFPPPIKAGGIHSLLGTAEGEFAKAHPQGLRRKMESGPWPGGRTVGHSIK